MTSPDYNTISQHKIRSPNDNIHVKQVSQMKTQETLPDETPRQHTNGSTSQFVLSSGLLSVLPFELLSVLTYGIVIRVVIRCCHFLLGCPLFCHLDCHLALSSVLSSGL
jgi:hypothetical protein